MLNELRGYIFVDCRLCNPSAARGQELDGNVRDMCSEIRELMSINISRGLKSRIEDVPRAMMVAIYQRIQNLRIDRIYHKKKKDKQFLTNSLETHILAIRWQIQQMSCKAK